jgi:hypothetical protein
MWRICLVFVVKGICHLPSSFSRDQVPSTPPALFQARPTWEAALSMYMDLWKAGISRPLLILKHFVR